MSSDTHPPQSETTGDLGPINDFSAEVARCQGLDESQSFSGVIEFVLVQIGVTGGCVILTCQNTINRLGSSILWSGFLNIPLTAQDVNLNFK